MIAFMLVCEFLYILILFYFSGFETRTMTVSCPKDLSVGHLNIYHLANKVTDVNVLVHQTDILHIFGVSEFRLTFYVSDEVVSIPNYSILRRDAMNLDIQGSRCMFITLLGISLIAAMIWNLRM